MTTASSSAEAVLRGSKIGELKRLAEEHAKSFEGFKRAVAELLVTNEALVADNDDLRQQLALPQDRGAAAASTESSESTSSADAPPKGARFTHGDLLTPPTPAAVMGTTAADAEAGTAAASQVAVDILALEQQVDDALTASLAAADDESKAAEAAKNATNVLSADPTDLAVASTKADAVTARKAAKAKRREKDTALEKARSRLTVARVRVRVAYAAAYAAAAASAAKKPSSKFAPRLIEKKDHQVPIVAGGRAVASHTSTYPTLCSAYFHACVLGVQRCLAVPVFSLSCCHGLISSLTATRHLRSGAPGAASQQARKSTWDSQEPAVLFSDRPPSLRATDRSLLESMRGLPTVTV